MQSTLTIQDRLNRVHFFDHVVRLRDLPLSNTEVLALSCFIKAADLMTDIFLTQVSSDNERLAVKLRNRSDTEGQMLYQYFMVHGSPWDSFDHNEPFVPNVGPRPAIGPFYPSDLTEDEWKAWLEANPQDREVFESPYTVIKRNGGQLLADPYQNHYRRLEEAAALLEVGATYLSPGPLRNFIELRAAFFRGKTNHYASDSAWVDLRGEPFEITIGPHESYIDDPFLGLKTAFESYIGILNKDATALLQRFVRPAREFDALLATEYPFTSRPAGPMLVLDDIYRAGECRFGRQFVAQNLPNDRRIHDEKGSKQIFSRTMLAAKFTTVGIPIAQVILSPDDQKYCTVENRLASNVGHELAHGMGPTMVTHNGQQVRFGVILKDLHSTIEEAKADMLGVRFLEYCRSKGIVDSDVIKGAIATELIVTLMGLRKSFTEAHARGNLVQYNWLKAVDAWHYHEGDGIFVIDYDRALEGMVMLSNTFLQLQLAGNYEQAREFMEKWGEIPPELPEIVKRLEHIPLEVHPRYIIED